MSYLCLLFSPHCRPLPPSTCFLFLTYRIGSNKRGYILIKNNSKVVTNAYFSLLSHLLWVQAMLQAGFHNPHGREECAGDPTPTDDCSYPERILVTSTPTPLATVYAQPWLTTAELGTSICHTSRRRTDETTGERHEYPPRIPCYLSLPYFIFTEWPLSLGCPTLQSLSWLTSIPIG